MPQPRKNNTTAAARRTARQRGYDAAHFKQRGAWASAVALGAVRCALCGERIEPGAPWDLAHADHPNAHQLRLYAGPAHRRCNVAQANRKHLPGTAPPRRRPPALALFDPPKRTGTEVC